MNPLKKTTLLPHEILFGLYLLMTWARLVWAVGFFGRDALVYLGFLVVNALLIARCVGAPTPLRWRLRLLFYPLAVTFLFAYMKVAVPEIHPASMDDFLERVDTALIGTNLSLRMQALVHPVLTELMSASYILFFPYLTFSLIYYFFGDLELLKKFFVGLYSLYGLGFLGYTLVPALGPHLAMTGQFTVPLDGWWITRWNAELVRVGSNHVDVFPSLHCAVSSFILFFDRVRKPWRFKLYLVPCIGLWISTLYLRYHYFIDVICGFALAALSLWIVNRYSRNANHEIPA